MTARLEDVLKTNVVLVGIRLLSTLPERDAFRRVVETDVSEVAPSIQLGISAGPTQLELGLSTLVLDRDRITLELTPDRSTISREYPSKEGLERMAEVVGHAIDLSNPGRQQLRAFGFNVEVIYVLGDEDTAYQYIAARLLAPDLFRNYFLRGGAARFHLVREDQTWNLNIEPRFSDPATNKVFVSLNLHFDSPTMPSKSLIRESLQKVWAQAHSIMDEFERE